MRSQADKNITVGTLDFGVSPWLSMKEPPDVVLTMQFEIFPDRLILRREATTHDAPRFFKMIVHRDLFGGASLMRESGQIGRAGHLRIEHHQDEGAAVDALAVLAAKKRKYGYQ